MQHTNAQQVEFRPPVHLALYELQSMNVPFDGPRTPGQGERSSHGGLVTLQLPGEAMERGFISCRAPGQPGRGIALAHHAMKLFGQFYGSGDSGGKGTQVLRETLLRRVGLGDQAEQERTGLSRTRTFLRWGVRNLRRTPAHSEANPKPAAQCTSGEIHSLVPQLAPQLAAIVATFSPSLF